jgi:hypothetical protein
VKEQLNNGKRIKEDLLGKGSFLSLSADLSLKIVDGYEYRTLVE